MVSPTLRISASTIQPWRQGISIAMVFGSGLAIGLVANAGFGLHPAAPLGGHSGTPPVPPSPAARTPSGLVAAPTTLALPPASGPVPQQAPPLALALRRAPPPGPAGRAAPLPAPVPYVSAMAPAEDPDRSTVVPAPVAPREDLVSPPLPAAHEATSPPVTASGFTLIGNGVFEMAPVSEAALAEPGVPPSADSSTQGSAGGEPQPELAPPLLPSFESSAATSVSAFHTGPPPTLGSAPADALAVPPERIQEAPAGHAAPPTDLAPSVALPDLFSTTTASPANVSSDTVSSETIPPEAITPGDSQSIGAAPACPAEPLASGTGPDAGAAAPFCLIGFRIGRDGPVYLPVLFDHDTGPSLRLDALLDALASRYQRGEFARLRSAPASGELVSLAALLEQGFRMELDGSTVDLAAA